MNQCAPDFGCRYENQVRLPFVPGAKCAYTLNDEGQRYPFFWVSIPTGLGWFGIRLDPAASVNNLDKPVGTRRTLQSIGQMAAIWTERVGTEAYLAALVGKVASMVCYRNSPGVAPKRERNTSVIWLCDENPHWNAICARDFREPAINCFA